MKPARVSNPGPLTYESGALPIVLLGPDKSKGLPYLFAAVKGSAKTCSRNHDSSRTVSELF